MDEKMLLKQVATRWEAYELGLSEGRKQGLREAVSIMKRHPEGEGEWCDTGEDMEWACRSECVERAVKRIRAAIEKADYKGGSVKIEDWPMPVASLEKVGRE